MQAGGLTDYLLPEAGLKTSSADAFADFDEAETDVSATAKDPDMPASATLAPKRPDILSWPESGSGSNRRDGEEVPVQLYRYPCSTAATTALSALLTLKCAKVVRCPWPC